MAISIWAVTANISSIVTMIPCVYGVYNIAVPDITAINEYAAQIRIIILAIPAIW